MEISISYETVPKMFEICKKLKVGKLEREELEEILAHDDYQIELDRYNKEASEKGKFSKEDFIYFFMNIFSLRECDIKQGLLKARYSHLRNLLDNVEFYEKKFQEIKTITEEDVLSALEYTNKGLPEDVRFDKLNFIFSIGLGPSGGWFYKNYSHFDIIQFSELGKDIILNGIAHECHHIGFNKMFEDLDITKITPEEYLYLFLAGEGLAIKYCNNGEGVLTKRIYKDEANIGLDKFTWDYLTNDFNNIFDNFKSQINKIRNKEIKDINELNEYISKYWMNRHTDEQNENEVPKLKHSRNYSFGNDIWGLIHDVYGSQKVFETLRNLKQFPKVFNSALEKIGRTDLSI
ncbi:DUF5700 domain-containing putative Zn-dependent protease [Caloranaerobacter ferrireducens]|uniref:DUF5700 domain-containing putative Zn-dependent protease n=1 Tax=Caloranaerobacter ferrireducens TaxID=1323370 RepID=UPI00084D1343|nr:DUF5700 domain-containing putative Zn-dependent protease [Caloranaerobacter ferrireducens]